MHEESRRRHRKKNGELIFNTNSQAAGLWQVTPIGLKDYNTFTKGKDYTTNDIKNEKINGKVGLWLYTRNVRYYNRRGFDSMDGLVLSLNAYNMGLGNTEMGKIYFKYVSNIVPDYFIRFINSRLITKKGTKVYRIKSLYVEDIDSFLMNQYDD